MAKKGRRARSMRGEVVDFDLMEIKNQMANQPKPTEVKAREDFIEQRLRRRKNRIERNRQAQLEATTEVREEEKEVAEEPAPELKKRKVREPAQPPDSVTKEVIQKAVEEVTKTRRIKKKKTD